MLILFHVINCRKDKIGTTKTERESKKRELHPEIIIILYE
jgi:hypothetical protein